MNETQVTVIGNVITDIKRRRTPDSEGPVSFRLATNERRFDKTTQQWVDGDRLYLSVTCWRRLAEGVLLSLTKGDPVIVQGRLYTRHYELDGQKRSVTELDAWAVGPDLGRCSAIPKRPRREAFDDAAPEVPEQAGPADQENNPPRSDAAAARPADKAGRVNGEPARRSLQVVSSASS
jgi:single-strand DNA-binding protein